MCMIQPLDQALLSRQTWCEKAKRGVCTLVPSVLGGVLGRISTLFKIFFFLFNFVLFFALFLAPIVKCPLTLSFLWVGRSFSGGNVF